MNQSQLTLMYEGVEHCCFCIRESGHMDYHTGGPYFCPKHTPIQEESMAERTLVTDRLYSLGDYKNIRFVDTIIGVPDDEKEVMRYRVLQLLSIEEAFKRYSLLMQGLSQEESLQKATDRIAVLREETINSKVLENLETK